MGQVTSNDGTKIAYSKIGSGPALIIVDGALCSRSFGPAGKLAEALAPHFTVYTYDRRGRGESGNTAPYDVAREVEDIAALIEEAGGRAHLFGMSSGGTLVAEAVHRGVPVNRFAIYESPMVVDGTREPMSADLPAEVSRAVAEDRRGDAVKLFMDYVGTPKVVTALMRIMPPWKKLKAVAHTLPHDFALVGEFQRGVQPPADRWAGAKAPGLVIAGGKSPEYMRNAQASLARALPDAELKVLDGQTHMVKAQVTAPVLVDFLDR
ncbi:pimeloyl-ACP methyl ester carboxylesterase [Saccharothrix tamanrassetensis]|uniref:Pimeloyl-ACP methyl ester carboxylesterase n=1 Tax=Saccharothrix tamanrassetensis TaxID=1051531 RepID=A0A841CHG7_9PSEU|nr:alpha/beta hydrolase [Saccharothrix tamanrassetensis]MBB5956433.1 pimeloyl-ACP methyl ester carboxylesterase [Saccharothrix tamanrassetensis]